MYTKRCTKIVYVPTILYAWIITLITYFADKKHIIFDEIYKTL